MKQIINYSLLLVALLFIMTGCYKNPNWKILTGVIPEGIYIKGTATVFSAEGTAAKFATASLDGHDPVTSVQEKYVWLKKEGNFQIAITDNNNQTMVYGKGSEIESNHRFSRYELLAGTEGFTVPEDGLYCLIVCEDIKQISILPVKWGIIGAATPDGWNAETLFVLESPYDPVTTEVVYKLSPVDMLIGEYKFRYSGDWGFEIPYDATGTKIKVHTDLTSSSALTESYSALIVGTDNIALAKGGNYEVGLKFNATTSKFSAYIKLLGASTVPQPPTELYLTGDNFGDWNWGTGTVTMIPTNNPNVFWAIVWMGGDNTKGFKMNSTLAWSGKEFGITAGASNTVGTESVYKKGGDNIAEPATAGYYMVTYKFNADGNYNDSISIKPAEVYLTGSTSPSTTWGDANPLNLFTIISGTIFTSPNFSDNGDLRIFTYHRWIADWWGAEFTILSGKIEFRGKGSDQERTTVTAGSHCTLDFTTGTGTITP